MEKQTITIGLVQINERKEGMARSGHQRNSNNEILHEVATYPYSVGLLQAYAEKHYSGNDDLQFLLPIYKRMSIKESVAHLLTADIVGFSAYVWNINLTLEVARNLKKAKPEIIILFGGPQVPDHAAEFLNENPFIDMVCHGEGEQVFLSVLENFHNEGWKTQPSISYLNTSGIYVSNQRIARTKELEEIPSPYLQGTFDPLRAANPGTSWIMLWETNRGCPFSCSYCDWGSAVGTKVNKFGDTRLYRELEWYAKSGGDIIFCCDANFGMFPRDYELAEFAVLIKKIYKHPRILTVQNTKNATEKAYKIQKLLAAAKLNPVVTLSVQSVNEETLTAIKRKNISLETFRELQKRFTRDNVLTYTDVILGMPGETYDSYFNGISTIIDGGQHHRILFYNLSILPNAEMGDLAYQEKYGLKTVPQLIQNMHTHLYEVEECPEYIHTVVQSNSMPMADWVKSKCVWWVTEMLYYNMILKLPIALLRKTYDISYRKLLEAFMNPDEHQHPICFRMNAIMLEKARQIQSGDIEFYPAEDWLNIYWTTEQYIWIYLVSNNLTEEFYREAELLLKKALTDEQINFNQQLVHEACQINKLLMVEPGEGGNTKANVSWNFFEIFIGVMSGEDIELREEDNIIEIEKAGMNFEDWLEYQIFCQNSKFKQWHTYNVISVQDKSLLAIAS